MVTTTTTTRVHVYSRSIDEWVVFESGHFDDHVIFSQVDDALHHARLLAEQCDGTVKAHGIDVVPVRKRRTA
jgi:hypothetical protein